MAFAVGGAATSAVAESPSPSLAHVAVPFSKGDVFAGIGNGRWNHFDSSGTLLSTLDDGQIQLTSGFEPPHATAGVCFDPAGEMYGMNLDNNSVSKFSNDGTLLAATVGTFSQNPEACLIVDSNTMFTSQVRGTGGLLKLDLAGNPLAKYG